MNLNNSEGGRRMRMSSWRPEKETGYTHHSSVSTNDTQADIIGSEKCTIFEACTQVENAFNRAEAPWPKLY